METAITDAFLASISTAVSTCMETVKEESRKFVAALGAVRHLPTAQPVPPTSVPLPPTPTPVPDTTHLEHRLSALELAYQRQVQKTIAGLSEDIGDIDGRLARLERDQREEPVTSAWSWPGPSRTNEVVVVDDKSTVLDFGLGDMLVNVHHVEDEDVDMLPPALVPVQVQAQVQAPVQAQAPVEVPRETPEEEEEEGLELEDFEHEGETYYKDADNNVYKANDAGEVDVETPIGRWLEKRKTIKLYD